MFYLFFELVLLVFERSHVRLHVCFELALVLRSQPRPLSEDLLVHLLFVVKQFLIFVQQLLLQLFNFSYEFLLQVLHVSIQTGADARNLLIEPGIHVRRVAR